MFCAFLVRGSVLLNIFELYQRVVLTFKCKKKVGAYNGEKQNTDLLTVRCHLHFGSQLIYLDIIKFDF